MKTHARALLLIATILLAPTAVRAADATEKYTFVVVHGATAGGWEWKKTGDFLKADGHTVYRVTLSGLGDGMFTTPWVKPDAKPPHNTPQSIKCFDQPVSYKNPAALALPVTYVAFVPADKSAEERVKTDKSWQRAESRGWTIRTFPGGHVAQQEDPRGVAKLMAEAVSDRNRLVEETKAAPAGN